MSRKTRGNIGVNAILNTIRSCMAVLFPLITYPYAARVLGVENLGKVNYGYSIMTYFSLLAALGVSTYAVRSGSQIRNDKPRLTAFSNQVFTINLYATVLAYALMTAAVSFVPKFRPYRAIILIEGIGFICTTFNVDWVNTIFEDYFIVTVRTLITYAIGLVLLFVFVRQSSDYYKYVVIQVLPMIVAAALNWWYCRRYVRLHAVRNVHLSEHLKPLLIFFVNAVAIQVYVNIDTTMLGWMKGDYYVGIYSVSVKIYTVIKGVLLSIYSVTIPRLSNYFGDGDRASYKQLMTKISSAMMLLLLPAAFGIICMAKELVYFIGGSTYSDGVLCLQILGIALVFAIFGGLSTSVLNVTTCREKENLTATVIGAVLNAALNLFFIPLFYQNGAAFTTLLAECVVFLYCFVRFPNKSQFIDLKTVGKNLIHGLIGSGTIILLSSLIRLIPMNPLVRLFAVVLASVLVYAAELFLLKNQIFLDAAGKMLRKVRRNRPETNQSSE